jgi:hypothetical protein
VSGRSEGILVVAVLVGFIVLCIWIVMRMGAGKPAYPPGSSYSPNPDGVLALYELLQASGMQVRRFGDSEYEYPKQACMLLVEEGMANPSQLMFSQLNVKALALWLQEGGRLVLFSSALQEDYAPWSSTGQQLLDYLDGKEIRSGSMFESPAPASGTQASNTTDAAPPEPVAIAKYKGAGQAGSATAPVRDYRPGYRYVLNKPRPKLFADVGEIEAAELSGLKCNSAIPLLSAGDPPEPVLLHRQVGQGELYWMPRSEVCTNSWLRRADNHRLMLAVLAYAARGRTLYIDEHIHGYNRDRSNAGSMLLHTLGGKLILGAGLALALCFLGAAVRPARFQPQPPPPRRTSTEMVLAQAGLFRRAGLRRGVVERLLDGVRRAYMREYVLPMLPDNNMLLGWARGYAGSGMIHAKFLLIYLETGAVPRGETELVRLARACDWARERLEQERRD